MNRSSIGWSPDYIAIITTAFKFYCLKIPLLSNLIKQMKIWLGREIVSNDQSYLAAEVIGEISDIFDYRVYPFFGTLLSIVRDGKFNFADDFDFATTDVSIFTEYNIRTLHSKGFHLHKISFVKNNNIVELSFLYKGVNVDIFLLDIDSNGDLSHSCPDFRTCYGKLHFAKSKPDIYKILFNKYFAVRYPSADLIMCEKWGCVIPENAKEIFEIHYGKDWLVPKLKNFIDFKCYEFYKDESYIIMSKENDSEALIDFIFKSSYLHEK